MVLANVPASAPAAPATAAGIVFPAAAALALKQGQVLDARVVQALGGDAVRLNIQGVLIDALAGTRLEQGTLLRVRVDGAGSAIRLAILAPSTGQAALAQAVPAPQPAASLPAHAMVPGAGPSPAPSSSALAAAPQAGADVSQSLQRLFGDVLRSLAAPGGAVTQDQRAAAARILNLSVPQPAGGTQPQAPPALPASALAQVVAGMAQALAQDGDGAGEMVRQAAARLFGLAQPQAQPSAQALPPPAAAGSAVKALFASSDLVLAGNPKEVPLPVREALANLAALRVAVTPALSGEALKGAVAASGVFAEAHMAQGPAPQAAGDMKLALFILRDAVRGWLGEDSKRMQPGADRPAQAGRSANTPASARMESPAGVAREMARVLLAQTDAALARLRVAQVAALPERAEPGAMVTTDQNGSLHVALPLSAGGRPGFLSMQIDRDGSGRAEEDESGGWRVRFSLDAEPAGPAQAVVGLKAGEVSVSLWAERGETAAVLAAQEPLLRDMLKQAGLEAGALAIRRGKPAAQIWAGARLLDRRS